MRRTHALVLVVLAVLAILAYAPTLSHPLLEDDYPNIEIARKFAPVSGWPAMFADGIFRYRATFWLMTYWIDRLSGTSPAAFYAASIILHVLCTWLVYGLGAWRVAGWRTSAVAAAFFAIYEGHQEAVMWYSASAELLQFLFGIACLYCWIRFAEKRAGGRWYAAALAFFILAMLSKESAVIIAPLLLLVLWVSGMTRRAFAAWLPFGALAALAIALIIESRAYSFRFQDGSFSALAPFWITLPVSFGRLLWIWGLLSLVAVVVLRDRHHRQLVVAALLWIPIAFLPYSFLTYMHRIPSRQTYLASLGLAWIISAGFWTLYARLHLHRKASVAVVVALVIFANIGYLWTKKRKQFLERAAPTEAVVELARKVNGPIFMRCYPGAAITYEAAVRLRAGQTASRLVWKDQPAAADFCWEKPRR